MKIFLTSTVLGLSFVPSSFADPGCSATAANQLYKKGTVVMLAVDACQGQAFTKLGLKKYSVSEIDADRAAYQKAQLEASSLGQSIQDKLQQFVAARQEKREAYLKNENSARKAVGLKKLTLDEVFQEGESTDQLA